MTAFRFLLTVFILGVCNLGVCIVGLIGDIESIKPTPLVLYLTGLLLAGISFTGWIEWQERKDPRHPLPSGEAP